MKRTLALFLFVVSIIIIGSITVSLTYVHILSFKKTSKPTVQPIVQFEENPNHIYIINVSTGIFKDNVDWAIIVPPSIVGNMLILTTSGPMNMSSRGLEENIGSVVAINLITGKLMWEVQFPNQIMTQPIIVNNTIIVGLGNNEFPNYYNISSLTGGVIRGTGVNCLVALNLAGKILWRFPTSGEDMPTPVYYNGNIIEANGNDQVFSLTIKGNLSWIENISSYVSMSSPVLVNGTIYFGGAHPYTFYAVNASNGKILWQDSLNATGGLDDSSPAYANGIVVTSYTRLIDENTSLANYLTGINSSNGKLIWTVYEGDGSIPPNLESPPPTIYDDIVFHDTPTNGTLYAVNLTNGNILWTFYTGPTTANANILEGKYVVILNGQGELFVLSLNGTFVKEINTEIMSGPGNVIVTNNTLILWGLNGIIETIPINYII
ncbi:MULTISPECIES: PQQ-binding-like beta-propeller repeat protein [Acidianus]|uniref:Pyrrolo-quinoline quinone n=1 Tax=Candidatus Acidianus copahuensis TaxID=1160895 RepID=A0A031LQG6_9CREN|nr:MULTISPECIES: PQQ-binding-like beta-propeller repeat protein [Acidianus]EZQ10587.1 pyrrolo-quinoline quinone [Candidatus Acidianus copahuensis]NON63429.1 PQQ-binding-like beta-propeller repeat protein [Acidianus sp. RZ1]